MAFWGHIFLGPLAIFHPKQDHHNVGLRDDAMLASRIERPSRWPSEPCLSQGGPDVVGLPRLPTLLIFDVINGTETHG